MAVFHYKFHLVPKSISAVSEECDYWNGRNIDNMLLNQFRAILPVDKSWDETEEYRSCDKFGSVIYLWKENGCVKDLQIEWTPGDLKTLQKVVEIAKQMDSHIFSRGTGSFLEADIELILADWKRTKSARFISEPAKVIVNSAEELKRST